MVGTQVLTVTVSSPTPTSAVAESRMKLVAPLNNSGTAKMPPVVPETR